MKALFPANLLCDQEVGRKKVNAWLRDELQYGTMDRIIVVDEIGAAILELVTGHKHCLQGGFGYSIPIYIVPTRLPIYCIERELFEAIGKAQHLFGSRPKHPISEV